MLLLITSTDGTVGLLSCGPEGESQQVVGIPLAQAGKSDEYFRPAGCYAVLRSIAEPTGTPRLIHIRNDSRPDEAVEEKELYWFYDEDAFAEVGLDLIDVNPVSCWEQEQAMLVSTFTPSDDDTHRILARFRSNEEECSDFVVLLEFSQQSTSAKPGCHAMVCGRGTSLNDLALKVQYVAQKARGKRSASNGLVNLGIGLEPDQQQLVVTITPEVLLGPPDVTIDITAELQKANLRPQLLEIWKAKKENEENSHILEMKIKDMGNWLEQAKREREMVEDELRKLEDRKRRLVEKESGAAKQLRLMSERQAVMGKEQEKLSKIWLNTRRRWDKLCRVDCGEDSSGEDGTDDSALIRWAVRNNDIDMIQLLSDKVAGLVVEDMVGGACLYWAAENGCADMIRLLLNNGADKEFVNSNGQTPLIAASSKGHLDVVQLLVDTGVDVNTTDENGHTALWYASEAGRETIVQVLRKCAPPIMSELEQTLEDSFNFSGGQVAFSTDLLAVALASEGGADIRDRKTWQPRKIGVNRGEFLSIAISSDSRWLAFGSMGFGIQILNAATGQLRYGMSGYFSSRIIIAFSPDSTILASTTDNGSIALWDLVRGEQKGYFMNPLGTLVSSVAFSPGSTLLASGSADSTLRLWDMATLQQRRLIQGHGDDIVTVTFSPNSAILASGSKDKTVRLWNPLTGQLRQTLEGHSDAIRSITFSPNSEVLASGSDDKTIKLWDVATGRLLQTLQGLRNGIISASFSADSTVLASASFDNTVKLWVPGTGQYKGVPCSS